MSHQPLVFGVPNTHTPGRFRFSLLTPFVSLHFSTSIVTLELPRSPSSILDRVVCVYSLKEARPGSSLPLPLHTSCVAVCSHTAWVAAAFGATVSLWDCSGAEPIRMMEIDVPVVVTRLQILGHFLGKRLDDDKEK